MGCVSVLCLVSGKVAVGPWVGITGSLASLHRKL